jgi:hypothetical protein
VDNVVAVSNWGEGDPPPSVDNIVAVHYGLSPLLAGQSTFYFKFSILGVFKLYK